MRRSEPSSRGGRPAVSRDDRRIGSAPSSAGAPAAAGDPATDRGAARPGQPAFQAGEQPGHPGDEGPSTTTTQRSWSAEPEAVSARPWIHHPGDRGGAAPNGETRLRARWQGSARSSSLAISVEMTVDAAAVLARACERPGGRPCSPQRDPRCCSRLGTTCGERTAATTSHVSASMAKVLPSGSWNQAIRHHHGRGAMPFVSLLEGVVPG